MFGRGSAVVVAGVLGWSLVFAGSANAAEGPLTLDSGLSLAEWGLSGDATAGAFGHEVGLGAGSADGSTGLSGGTAVPVLDGGCGFGAEVTQNGTTPDVQCGFLGEQVGLGTKIPVGDQEAEGGVGADLFGHQVNVPVSLPLGE
jgi:hypothetical protein